MWLLLSVFLRWAPFVCFKLCKDSTMLPTRHFLRLILPVIAFCFADQAESQSSVRSRQIKRAADNFLESFALTNVKFEPMPIRSPIIDTARPTHVLGADTLSPIKEKAFSDTSHPAAIDSSVPSLPTRQPSAAPSPVPSLSPTATCVNVSKNCKNGKDCCEGLQCSLSSNKCVSTCSYERCRKSTDCCSFPDSICLAHKRCGQCIKEGKKCKQSTDCCTGTCSKKRCVTALATNSTVGHL